MDVLHDAVTSPVDVGKTSDDSALVDLARAGDGNAFGELVLRHQRRVWLVCRQYLGPQDAEGATQDSFIKAFTNIERFDGRAAFTTWLTRIAINTCLDTLRRSARRPTLANGGDHDGDADPLLQLADDSANPERRSIERETVKRLAALEAELPERQREVFRLRFYAEMELEDIAAAMDVHVGTVKTQLHRAVHRLRQALGDHR